MQDELKGQRIVDGGEYEHYLPPYHNAETYKIQLERAAEKDKPKEVAKAPEAPKVEAPKA